MKASHPADNLTTIQNRTAAPQVSRILDTIRAIRAEIGEGLNDSELTQLLKTILLSESGFVFLSFFEGFVTLTVPEQDRASWYPEHGWITTEQEQVARAIAKKYGLTLSQPVNVPAHYIHPQGEASVARHHLEFSTPWETVVVAHPLYLKIRIVSHATHHEHAWDAVRHALGPNLLTDLSALYNQKNST